MLTFEDDLGKQATQIASTHALGLKDWPSATSMDPVLGTSRRMDVCSISTRAPLRST